MIGRECGCEQHVKIFQSMGIWIENGTIVPKPGDIILYNWDQSYQPNNGYSDHIGFRTEFTVYNNLYDNGYENYDNLLDSSEGTIIDSNVDPIVARAYSSSLILDSNGQPIDGRVIFCIR